MIFTCFFKLSVFHPILGYLSIEVLKECVPQVFCSNDIEISELEKTNLQKWITLFLKRTVQYIGFAEVGDRYERRRLLCAKMCEEMIAEFDKAAGK